MQDQDNLIQDQDNLIQDQDNLMQDQDNLFNLSSFHRTNGVDWLYCVIISCLSASLSKKWNVFMKFCIRPQRKLFLSCYFGSKFQRCCKGSYPFVNETKCYVTIKLCEGSKQTKFYVGWI